ncbi:NLR family CARD domain-containing protein 3-like isoform X3 [Megalobrama amblycephala]|uniref:NLR family CARD domain-containing protein 3-like isoform X3 n=1 Tax=Megalobrama amblycephala TaxID=75352 RepID=UPI002013EEAF|nr:NLR family CARD domain-containing protein 3-like isoform X3 [Megalobrama amblycephala]
MDPSLQSETPALKQKTSDSPMCSCVSMRSNASKQIHDEFKGDCTSEDRQKTSDSPMCSCVSMRSNASKQIHDEFKGDCTSEDRQKTSDSPMCSCVSMRSNASKQIHDEFKGDCTSEDRQKISGSPEHSCVPMKSDAGIKCDHTSEDSIKLKTKLQKKFQHLHEPITKQGNPTLFNEIYTELSITEDREHIDEYEIRPIETAVTENRPINCNDIFKELPGQNKRIRSVLTKGVAGIGKTVSVQKFVLDWAEGKKNQDIHIIFSLPFRELNLLKDETFSLKDLLQFFMDTKHLEISPNEDKIIFIFDGLDECHLSLDFQNNMRLCDVTESASVDVLLTNLIVGNLLPSALIWITSRPAAADLIPSEFVDRVTEVQGFNDPQKEEYFKKRIRDQSLADKIVSHLKSSMSLYIMCQIPVFCWISATVLEKMLSGADSGEIPKTLNQMYTHFLILQTNIKHEKDYVEKANDEELILKLGKLAFQELMKRNVIFKEEDLRECGIDVKEAVVYSGLCAHIGEEFSLRQRKVCFVHLSIQEHLAALYVHHTFITQNINVFVQMTKSTHRHVPISDLHQKAVDKTLESKTGHLGLFLRFLLGFSLESNQTLLKALLAQIERRNHSLEETVNYIKKKIEEDPTPEKFINLFHCLHDLGDSELVEQIQLYLKCRDPCEVKEKCCAPLAVALTSEYSCAKEMNLNGNKLRDAGVKLLSVVLGSSHCTLEILRLRACDITDEGCAALASGLKSNPSHLRELDLSENKLGNSGINFLANEPKCPTLGLEELWLIACGITHEGCAALASALTSNLSQLKELNLSNNVIGDSGLKRLSAALESADCKLETLGLNDCGVRDEGCAALISALTSNPSPLSKLDLSGNEIGASTMEQLSALQVHSDNKLNKVKSLVCSCSVSSGCV